MQVSLKFKIEMKKITSFTILSLSLLLLITSCKKDSPAATPIASVTLGTTTFPLNGFASAISYNNGDSLNIVNSSSTVSTNIESTTANTVIISLNSPTPITAGTTYSAGFGVKTEIVGFYNTGALYVGGSTRSGTLTNILIKIDSLNTTKVSGTYSGTVVNSTNYTTNSITGNFKANF